MAMEARRTGVWDGRSPTRSGGTAPNRDGNERNLEEKRREAITQSCEIQTERLDATEIWDGRD
jgi:hypothetical protein